MFFLYLKVGLEFSFKTFELRMIPRTNAWWQTVLQVFFDKVTHSSKESHAGKNLQPGYSNAEGKSRATKTSWVEDHSSILYLTYPRGGGEDNSPKCAILLLCAQCPGLWIEAKLKVTLQTMFFTCKWSSSQVLLAWGWLHFLLQDRVSFIPASFHILPPTNGLFEALSYTLSKRTDLP